VIGVTKNYPLKLSYQYGQVTRTIHTLNAQYQHNEKVRFGLVDFTKEDLLKDTLVNDSVPKIVVLKDGYIYKDA